MTLAGIDYMLCIFIDTKETNQKTIPNYNKN